MNASMPSLTGSLQIWCGAGVGSLPPPYGLLAILCELMAGHTLQPVFLVPKFQLFPTLVIPRRFLFFLSFSFILFQAFNPRRFLNASWDSESCSYCSLNLEPFSLLPWSRTLDRVGGVSQGFISWS